MQRRSLLALLPLVLPLASPILAADSKPLGAPTVDTTALVAPAPAGSATDDVHRQLADAQDKLSTALRSYTVLMDENSQLKDAAEKDAAEKSALAAKLESAQDTIAALRVQAAMAVQVETLRTEVRQLQDQIAALSAENARLKLRAALAGPPPAGGMPVPTRPGQQ
jgi:hypothetical protein